MSHTDIVSQLFPQATLTRTERLTGGVSADVYRLHITQANGSKTSVVLRVHGATHSGHPAALEHQLLNALHKAGLPVPQPIMLDVSRQHLPADFLLMDFIEGSTTIPAPDLNQYISKMASMLGQIHQTPTNPLPKLPIRDNPLPELFEFFPQGNEWQDLNAHLRTMNNTAYTGSQQLLHGDFWPENLLWQDGVISAVLDWEDAALGDPLCDVAAARVELRYKFGAQAMHQFADAYAQYQPIDEQRLALWQIYVAAAAQHYMGGWGLPAAQVAHMRKEALASIREAGVQLMG